VLSERERGFSLLEAVIAVSVLAVGVAGLAQIVVLSARTNRAAGRAAVAQQAARERLEQLRSLAWTSDGNVPVTDWNSNLTTTPPTGGGPGLATASDATLATNTAGFYDFIDASGRWMTGGPSAPRGAAWLRRWSVSTLDELPDVLVLQVVVMPATESAIDGELAAARSGNGAWLVSIHARRSR
jgi:type II secretory pathway pseudopilin PulG